MTFWITTNGRPSESATELAKQPGFKRAIKGLQIKQDDVLINWGSSDPIKLSKIPATVLNTPENVGKATNKLTAFRNFNGSLSTKLTNSVNWTTDKDIAKAWSHEGHVVVARTKLTGHSGDGIIIVDKKCPADVPDAPLYTLYVFKDREFRVHVVKNQIIDTQRKIRDPDREPTNWKVRSHENGFIFARNNIEEDETRDALARSALQSLGLYFGAVDIIQDRDGVYYVLEVNTAPGLEGMTAEKYANAFTRA